eukprot:7300509-Prymnesium_polylepis.1
MRKKRWEDNARWQIGLFARTHLGQFSGVATEYAPVTRDDGSVRFKKDEGECECLVDAPGEGLDGTIIVADKLLTAALRLDLQVDFRAFTPEAGNMAVGNAYTIVQ